MLAQESQGLSSPLHAAAMTSDPPIVPQRDSNARSALVLYATETGNAQDIALSLRPFLSRLQFSHVEVIPADDLPEPLVLQRYTLCIFVIATTGQGDFPINARKFWRMMLRKRLAVGKELKGVDFVTVGLGDRAYVKFNWAARKVRKRLLQLGATEICDACEADEGGDEGVEGGVNEWMVGFEAKVRELWDVGDDGAGDAVTTERGPRWLLSPAKEGTGASVNGLGSQSNGDGNDNGISGLQSCSRPTMDEEFPVTLTLNQRLTPPEHWQDVRLLRFHTPIDIEYLPGDALCLLPENDPADVNTVLDLMNWNDVADMPLILKPGHSDNTTASSSPSPSPSSSPLHPYPTLEKPPLPHLTQHPRGSKSQPTTTLRSLLLTTLDIRAIPRRSFFRTLAIYCTEDAFQRERLLEFTDPQYLDEYFDYATRPRRSILEILQEFRDGLRVPWQHVLELLPVLRGRLFSIASSRRVAGTRGLDHGIGLKSGEQQQQQHSGGTTFELLVAIVKYRTVIRRIRRGVCTRWLDGLTAGTQIRVALRTEGRFIKTRNGLLLRKKHILVGGGTGLAPLRSLIWEKESMQLHTDGAPAAGSLTQDDSTTGLRNGNNSESQTLASAADPDPKSRQPPHGGATPQPQTLLVFGARNRTQDFFFQDEWLALAKARFASFQLETAFSRDQAQKIYIQDRIREHGPQIRRMIVDEDAVVVVCGSSGQMPKAVRAALIDVLSGVGAAGPADAAVTDDETRKGMMSQEEAERYVERMEKEGRYLQETW